MYIHARISLYQERNEGITRQSQPKNESVSRSERELGNTFSQLISRPVINACRNWVTDSFLPLFFLSDWEFARELEESESVRGAQRQRATRGVDWSVLQPSSRQALQD